jgi:hypothetical protein
MDDLIKALQIFRKYGNPSYPTHCEHDVMYIHGIDPDNVSVEDIKELSELGFLIGDDTGEPMFQSFKFGSS